MSGDLKEGRNDVKAPLNLVPMWALYGCARVCRFGDNRYSPGNWKHAAADRERAFADYVDALLRHWSDMQEHGWDSVAPDSGLPHIDHLITNAMFIRGLMQIAGTLPRDPGRGNDPQPATTSPSDLVGKRVVRFDGRDVAEGPPWAPGDGFGETQYWGAQAKPDVDWTILEARDGWARCRFFDDLWFPVDAIAEVSE